MHLFLKFIFGIKLYMFQTVPLFHHQEFFTVHTAMVYVIQAVSKPCMTYNIAVYTVKNFWWWTEELFETCRVLFQK